MMTDVADTTGRYLRADHERLEALLARTTARPEAIDLEAYDAFRLVGLLRHIGLEEKILLPAARRRRVPAAARLRLDHGALAALFVPTPTRAIVAAIRAILAEHNRIEEAPGGVYDLCEQLAGAADAELLAALRAAPEVPVSPYSTETRRRRHPPRADARRLRSPRPGSLREGRRVLPNRRVFSSGKSIPRARHATTQVTAVRGAARAPKDPPDHRSPARPGGQFELVA